MGMVSDCNSTGLRLRWSALAAKLVSVEDGQRLQLNWSLLGMVRACSSTGLCWVWSALAAQLVSDGYGQSLLLNSDRAMFKSSAV